MKIIAKSSLIAALAALAACGSQEGTDATTGAEGGTENAATQAPPPAPDAGEVHSGTGTVASIAGDQVTISHEEIKSIGWPAMEMTFTAADASQLSGLKSGDRVAFSFRQGDGASTLTSVTKQ